jgi:hypothetical protein
VTNGAGRANPDADPRERLQGKFVVDGAYDTTSILATIEHRHGLRR